MVCLIQMVMQFDEQMRLLVVRINKELMVLKLLVNLVEELYQLLKWLMLG